MAAAAKAGTPHTSSSKLEDQAATTALYTPRGKSSSASSTHPLLDEDGRLSSASAATSLKYAKPQDLPSFPSPGLQLASAGAAASLADSNKKSFEHWKPDTIPAANKAALLAKDYEMDPLWQPELSSAGSKAAILAHRDGGKVDIWKPAGSEDGSSAAGQATKKKPPGAIVQREVPDDVRQKALLAATGAMAGSRRRAESAPQRPQDQKDSAWALNAAAKSHTGGAYFGSGDPGFEASRLQNMDKNNVSKQMYTSNPPVALEVEERNRQAGLRASAIAMAQKMYADQQLRATELEAQQAAADKEKARNRGISDTSSSVYGDDFLGLAQKYSGLEEAARKLAQERLAKLRDEHQEYREYYGQTAPTTRSRLPMRLRNRAASEGQVDEADEQQSRKIRSQMSIFQNKLAEIDNKKRQTDRDALMALAQKNVTTRLAEIDEKIFQETGKLSPQQQQAWEQQARERAQADSDTRLQNHGKVHIGNGHYIDQAEVDEIARKRLQPTLDEITAKADKQRALDEAVKLEDQKRKREIEEEKLQAYKAKVEQKRLKNLEKQEQAKIREEEQRLRKESLAAEKAGKGEARDSKEAKPKRFGSFFGGIGFGTSAGAAAAEGTIAEEEEPVAPDQIEAPAEESAEPASEVEGEKAVSPDVDADEQAKEESPAIAGDTEESAAAQTETQTETATSPTSPGKGDSKVKTWFKSRFRSSSKVQKDADGNDEAKPGFVGGAALTGAGTTEEDAGPEEEKSDSIREVAMVGRSSPRETDELYEASEKADAAEEAPRKKAASRSPSISSMSSHYETEKDEDKDKSKAKQPEADADEQEESRDKFEEQKAPTPPKANSSAEGSQPVKSIDTPSRERSRFTEDL